MCLSSYDEHQSIRETLSWLDNVDRKTMGLKFWISDGRISQANRQCVRDPVEWVDIVDISQDV